jgi:hypothetical protein
VQGWNIGGALGLEEGLADMREEWIPQKVKAEVKRYYKVKPLAVDMTRWLKMKSGQLEEERMR